MVSVCIPTFNAARFLPAAIASVLGQDFFDFELIIVDNASTDDTPALVGSIEDRRIQFFRNEHNVGALENHNVCLGHARGRYVKFLCADDVLQPGILGRMVAALEMDPRVTLVTFDILVTDEQLRPLNRWHHYPGLAAGTDVVRLCLERANNWIGGPSDVMFRREAAEGLRFDPSYLWFGDFKFFCQILLRPGAWFQNLNVPGSFYRLRAGSDTATSCPPTVQAHKVYDFLVEMRALNHLNCMILLRRPVGWARRLQLLGWLLGHCWDVRTMGHLLTTKPVGPHESILKRLLARLGFRPQARPAAR